MALKKAFEIEPYSLGDVTEGISSVPFGKLIGGILTACVDAQKNASEVAWNYTKRVLEKNTPMIFSFVREGKPVRLEVPLITIVPLPYLKLDNVNFDFDAEVDVNNESSNDFRVKVNNESATTSSTTTGTALSTSTAKANMHIDINAATTDMPAGLATLLNHINNGIIVNTEKRQKGSGTLAFDDVVDSIEHNSKGINPNLPPRGPKGPIPVNPTRPATGSGSGHGSGSGALGFNDVLDSLNRNSQATSSGTMSSRTETTGDGTSYFLGNSLNGLDATSTDLKALHVTWTAPSCYKFFPAKGHYGRVEGYRQEDFEVLSTVLSALLWRKFNGSIKLYTDTTGLQYYQQMGMTNLWNGGIDTQTLDSLITYEEAAATKKLNQFVPPDIFWAAGKIFATKAERGPFVMMDTDMLVWTALRPLIGNRQVMAFHPEPLTGYNYCYLPYELLKKRAGYTPKKNWDWKRNPFNTALVYYSNALIAEQFKDHYTDYAIDFMKGNIERPKEMVSQMVFAEQRIFGMETVTLPYTDFATFMVSADEKNRPFTHLWGSKAAARDDAQKYHKLCATLAKTIRNNFGKVSFPNPIQALLNKYPA